MAFCNTSQFTAKKLIKSKSITSCDQVERLFKSSAYLAWNNTDIFSEYGNTETGSTFSILSSRVKNLRKHKSKPTKPIIRANRDRDFFCNDDLMENTLIPLVDVVEGSTSDQQSTISLKRDNDKVIYNDSNV